MSYGGVLVWDEGGLRSDPMMSWHMNIGFTRGFEVP